MKSFNHKIEPSRLSIGEEVAVDTSLPYPMVEIKHPIYIRAESIFDQSEYKYVAPPLYLGERDLLPPDSEQYVLSCLIKLPDEDVLCVPKELLWLKDLLAWVAAYQCYFPKFKERYGYVTVRHGKKAPVGDTSFHADGFQGRFPRKLPEQNYIWSNSGGTQFALQPFFLEGLRPELHDANLFFNSQVKQLNKKVQHYETMPKSLMCIDPYMVHARTTDLRGSYAYGRTLVRITFSENEIKDPSSTINPMLPVSYPPRQDVRNFLSAYVIDESRNYGLC